MNKIEPIESR